jgi:MoxR-like ATPase
MKTSEITPITPVTPIRQEQATEVNPVVPASVDDIPTGPAAQTKNDLEAVSELADAHKQIVTEIEKRIIGQKKVVDQLLVALFARGHTLFVGVPGLAKTLLISTLAETLNLSFQRIQFTPDLMPADITGTEVLEEDHTTGRRIFRFIKGPVFANLVLADEINRTPPKTQAALLQSMQEFRVTAGGATHELPLPFLVFATQNPIEQEGTYPLPEAQLDRFMFQVDVEYPTEAEEEEIVRQQTSDHRPELSRVLSPQRILQLQELVRRVPAADHVVKYAVALARATRPTSPNLPNPRPPRNRPPDRTPTTLPSITAPSRTTSSRTIIMRPSPPIPARPPPSTGIDPSVYITCSSCDMTTYKNTRRATRSCMSPAAIMPS